MGENWKLNINADHVKVTRARFRFTPRTHHQYAVSRARVVVHVGTTLLDRWSTDGQKHHFFARCISNTGSPCDDNMQATQPRPYLKNGEAERTRSVLKPPYTAQIKSARRFA